MVPHGTCELPHGISKMKLHAMAAAAAARSDRDGERTVAATAGL
jgi:hypothetical protein